MGVVAAVAGCSGGGVTSSGAYVPPGGGTRPMTTAQITLQFGTGTSSGSRAAMALDSTVRQVGIRFIPLPAPNPTPTEQLFTIPQPAPASTTLTVSAPVGQDQFILGAYEPPPTCIASAVRQPATANRRPAAATRGPLSLPALVPINGSVQTVNLSANGLNAITAPVGPVAFGASISAAQKIGPGGAGYLGGTQWSPLENFNGSQTNVMTVTPVDVCGTQQPSTTFVNSAVVSGPGGVAFSSTSFSAQATTTATYGANMNSGGTISGAATLPANTAPQNPAQSVNIIPDYFIFAMDSSGSYLNVIDAQTGQNLASGGLTLAHSRSPFGSARQTKNGTRSAQNAAGGAQAIASVNASSCTSGAQAAAVAIAGNLNSGNGIDVITVAPNGTVSSPTFIPWNGGGGQPIAAAFDTACRLYAGDSSGYLGVAAAGGASISPVQVLPFGSPIYALVASSSSMYAGYYNNSSVQVIVATFPFGGTTLTPTSFAFSGGTNSLNALALAGGNVYVALVNSSGCVANFLTLSSSSVGMYSFAGCCSFAINQLAGTVAGSTLYAVTNTGYLVTVTGGSATASVMSLPSSGGAVKGVALSQDSPTSNLWLSGNGTSSIFEYSATGVTPTGLQWGVPFPNAGTGGPLSIAP